MLPKITAGQSTFLHLVKIIAIAAVFIGHATKPDILFDVDISLIGRATIPTFLMISGYFMAMTLYRARLANLPNGSSFAKTVLSRYFNMYFMFVPASFLVLAMDFNMVQNGAALVTSDKFDANLAPARLLQEAFQLFTFSGEYWSSSTFGQGVFSNAALWTIDYLMAYMVATAALYLLEGRARVLAFIVAVVVAGPTVLLLSPLWWFGVLAFELHRKADAIRADAGGSKAQGPWMKLAAPTRQQAILAFLGAIAVWMALEQFAVGQSLYAWSKTLVSYELRQYLGMAKRFAWQWTYIPVIFMFLFTSKFIFTGAVAPGVQSTIRTVSKYCYPVFAFHFTTMYFVQSQIPDYQASFMSIDPYLMALTSLAISIACGKVCFVYVKPWTDRLYSIIVGDNAARENDLLRHARRAPA